MTAHQSQLNMYIVGPEGGRMLGYYKSKEGGQGVLIYPCSYMYGGGREWKGCRVDSRPRM